MKTIEEILNDIVANAVQLEEGVGLRRAVIVLDEAKKKGINGYIEVMGFDNNPVKLYSLLDNEDSCYQKVIGKTKTEYDEEIRKANMEYDKLVAEAKQANIEKYAPRLPEWVERGREYIYPQKMKAWTDVVTSSLDYYPDAIEKTLSFMEMLKQGMSFDEIYEKMNDVPGAYYIDVRNFILNYAKQGPDFIKVKFPELYKHNKKYVDDLVDENKKYESTMGE